MTKIKDTEPGKPTNILVPIDFSAASKNAFSHALSLGRQGRRFILLHVIPPTIQESRRTSSLIAPARRSLTSFIKSDYAGNIHSLQFLVRIGTPFQEILTAAKENNVELIVLGVDDSELFGRLALGHTADRVSRYARCPVLLVRETEPVMARKPAYPGPRASAGV